MQKAALSSIAVYLETVFLSPFKIVVYMKMLLRDFGLARESHNHFQYDQEMACGQALLDKSKPNTTAGLRFNDKRSDNHAGFDTEVG